MAEDSGTGMKIVIGAIILSILLFIAGMVFVYFWDDIMSPAGDENSVPAPKTY